MHLCEVKTTPAFNMFLDLDIKIKARAKFVDYKIMHECVLDFARSVSLQLLNLDVVSGHDPRWPAGGEPAVVISSSRPRLMPTSIRNYKCGVHVTLPGLHVDVPSALALRDRLVTHLKGRSGDAILAQHGIEPPRRDLGQDDRRVGTEAVNGLRMLFNFAGRGRRVQRVGPVIPRRVGPGGSDGALARGHGGGSSRPCFASCAWPA